MTIYSLDVHLFLLGTSLLFHVQFSLLLPDLHIGFSRGRSGGLVFPSLSEFSTVYCHPHSQRLWHVNKAEIDVFLELSCFFHDPADVGNLISGQGTRSQSPQLRYYRLQWRSKISCATTKTWHSQINKYFLKELVWRTFRRWRRKFVVSSQQIHQKNI